MINHPHRKKKTASISTGSPAAKPKPALKPKPRVRAEHDHDYAMLLAVLQSSFHRAAFMGAGPLFATDAAGLYDLYLAKLPAERDVHNCSACRRFIETYGGLAKIDDNGDLEPVMWGAEVPAFYQDAFDALGIRVRLARVEHVFWTKPMSWWGQPKTGQWQHLAVSPPSNAVYHGRALTPGQAMAAAKENVRTVLGAMAEYPPRVLDEAIRVLESGHLDRAEKFLGPVRWLRALHDWPKGRANETRRHHLLWRAVATAPEGYCHIKSSVVAPLLADIVAGVPFETLRAKHAAKVEPTRYQRPQAAPAAGNIAAAEALFAKLGLAPALERRFARLDEVEVAWLAGMNHAARQEPAGGVFGHVKPKGAVPPVPTMSLPATTVTWAKFAATVLPRAERIEVLVPGHGRFTAFTAPVHADAPPILKWDRPERRNAVAWYTYPGGSSCTQWGLRATWTALTAVSPLPTLWGDKPMPFVGDGVLLVLDGAMDTRRGCGNALFPECLKDDLHGVRATIEAYSRAAELTGQEDGSVCGLSVRPDRNGAECTLRAFSGGAWSMYRVDRWD